MRKFLALTVVEGERRIWINRDHISQIVERGEGSSIWLSGQDQGWLHVKEAPQQILSQLEGGPQDG